LETVNIAQLKSELSRYLSLVRAGSEVIVRDRNIPVAMLVPIDLEDLTLEDIALVASGRLRPPRSKLSSDFWRRTRPSVNIEDLDRAIEADREDR